MPDPAPSDDSLHRSLKIREGVYGVLVHEDRVLMCHTRSGTRTIINFPGGAIDPGESQEQALQREFTEETGARAKVGRHLFSSDGTHINPDYPGNTQVCHYYLVQPEGELSFTINSADVEGLEWFSSNELPIDRMLPVDREFVAKLRDLL